MKVGAQTRPGFFAQPDVAIDHDDIGLAREFVQDGGDTRQLAPIEVPGLIRQDSLDIGRDFQDRPLGFPGSQDHTRRRGAGNAVVDVDYGDLLFVFSRG